MAEDFRMPSLTEIQAAMRAFCAGNVILYSKSGTPIRHTLTDAMLEGEQKFFSVMRSYAGTNAEIVTRVFADATKVASLPSLLYIDSIAYDAHAAERAANVPCTMMPAVEVQHALEFIYRATSERQRTCLDKSNMLFPNILKQIGGCGCR